MLTQDHPNKRFLPTLERVEPFIQDHTATIGAMNCMRKYFYRFVLGRVSKSSKNQIYFDFGGAYHKFREERKTIGFKEAFLRASEVKLPIVEEKHNGFHLNRDRLLKSCMVAHDYAENEKKQGKIEVIAIEQPFNVEIGEGVFIGGRADEIVKWNGRLWGRDFKTTTKDINFFSRGLDPNDQILRYIVGESKLHFGEATNEGKWIEGILIEVMQNLKSKPPTIYPIPVSRTTWQIQKWMEEQIWFNKVLKLAREEDIWMMQPHNCGWCDYHIVCKQPNERGMVQKLKDDYKFSPWDYTNVEQEVISE